MLERTSREHPIDTIQPVMTKEEVISLQEEVKDIYIDQQVQQYIIHLTGATRKHKHTFLGVSPRGSIALMKAAKAFAYIHNRDFVLPDDVQYLAPYVMTHRIILNSVAKYERITEERSEERS